MGREEERIWMNMEEGKNMMKIYFKLKMVLNNKNINSTNKW